MKILPLYDIIQRKCSFIYAVKALDKLRLTEQIFAIVIQEFFLFLIYPEIHFN